MTSTYDQNRDFRGGDAPGRTAFAITTSDTLDLTKYPRALYVGVSGDIVGVPIDSADGSTVTFKSVAVGILPMGFRQILATGTTATNILGID